MMQSHDAHNKICNKVRNKTYNKAQPKLGRGMKLVRVLRRAGQTLGWGLYLGTALLVALYLAWLTLARADFLYAFWYEQIGIGKTIADYAPKNRYRRHFELTDKAEHQRLFSELAQGIQQADYPFAQLIYRSPEGRPLGRLLTPDETQHLQDVSRLVAAVGTLGNTALALWLLAAILILWRRMPLPALRRQLLYGALGITSLLLAVASLGPTRVFYQFHIWLFPAGHRWFFYYQDSLMSTLMQAPDLFGWIAVTLLVLTLPLWLGLLWLNLYLLRNFRRQPGMLGPI